MLTNKEFEIVERKVSAWLINKDGQQRGKNHRTAHEKSYHCGRYVLRH